MILTRPSFDAVARFNELPSLLEANEARKKQATEETFKTLGQLFVAYNIESILGLALLHNHFLLEEGEILLGTGSLSDEQQKVTSQPVKIDKLASPVQGSNWRITPDDSYVPYEFRLEDEDKKIDFSSSEIHSFLEEFSRKLNELDLTNIFGICVIDKDNFLKPGIESTNGRKNITVPLTDTDKFDNSIEAVWCFDKEKKIVTRKCTTWCYGDEDGHKRVHKDEDE